jgi:hypothetical protein
MKVALVTCLLAAAMLVSGCNTANFLVYKDAKHFYMTSKGDSLRTVLCDSGDLVKVVKDAALPEKTQHDLVNSICSATAADKKREQVLAVLESMTKEQRTALKEAFVLNGYQVNTIANC